MTLALCALTALADLPTDALVLRAEQAEMACATTAWDAPVPCEAVLAVLWRTETNTLLPWPQQGHGCGPLQVLEVPGRTPACAHMREPVVGLRVGAYVWLRKYAEAGRIGRAFRFYNGSAHAERYAKKAEKRLRYVLKRCGGVVKHG